MGKRNTLLYFFMIATIVFIICMIWYFRKIEQFETVFPEGFNLENLIEYVGLEYLYDKKSKYQNISVVQINPNQYGYDKCLILNEEIQLCSNDEKMYHEFIVHFPASYLKSIKNVLLVGGGDLMSLREVMKYNVNRVDMLELDEKVIDVSLKYFKDSNISRYENDSRVTIHIGDAFKTIKKLPDATYDLVIIDVTEDSTTNSPVESSAFFKLCKAKMTKQGILVKNGYIVDNMPLSIRTRKQKIMNDLKMSFSKVGVFKVGIPTYEDTNEYKFIICSDKYGIEDNLQNDELKKISKNLEEYDINNHKSYITKDYYGE